ncbi:unnamed protein product [Brassica rapa]|uniref:Uncharacterized protein n=2 Tax=Brassica TaxID=3705 RepID=A0A3P5ZYI2_BRACM|nr:unnamed protein product [Brassica napus]CAG7882605.1 unnamed protein product [Brassica rapa]VDC81865.1 unnamed protein product [Brassica rapa]
MTTIKETHQLQSIHIHCLSHIHRRASIDQSRNHPQHQATKHKET